MAYATRARVGDYDQEGDVIGLGHTPFCGSDRNRILFLTCRRVPGVNSYRLICVDFPPSEWKEVRQDSQECPRTLPSPLWGRGWHAHQITLVPPVAIFLQR